MADKQNTDYSNYLLSKIKRAILEVEPEAEIYLFGSRSRGDYYEDSDWDILIILPGKITFTRRFAITDKTFQIEIDENELLNRIYYSQTEWYNDRFVHATPFYKNVRKDGLLL